MKTQFAAIGFAVLLALFGNWTSSENDPEAQRPGQHDRRGPAPEPATVGRTEYDEYDAADGVVAASLPAGGLAGGVFDGNGPQLVGVLLPEVPTTDPWAIEPELPLPLPEVPVWEIPVPEETVPEETVPEETVPEETVPEETLPVDLEAPLPVIDPVTGEPVPSLEDGEVPALEVTPEPETAPIVGEPVVTAPVVEPELEAPLAPMAPEETLSFELVPAEAGSTETGSTETGGLELASPDGVPGLGVVAVGALWFSGGRRRPARRTACAPLSPPSP
ncbi:hypothetical protein [Nocardioides pacificus]